jgi:phosphatidylglycerophosphate synthase
MQQLNDTPILTNSFNRSFTIARVIIIVTLILSVLYIGYRYGQICASDEAKLWRSYIFMVFSIIFIIAMFIIVASNSLVPYGYQGSAIFLVYAFVNLYIYYIQYMFTITKEESIKYEQIMRNGGV